MKSDNTDLFFDFAAAQTERDHLEAQCKRLVASIAASQEVLIEKQKRVAELDRLFSKIAAFKKFRRRNLNSKLCI